MLLFQELRCVTFCDCHFNGSVSSNVRYVTCCHGTDCHGELPSGRVQCFKMAKIDLISRGFIKGRAPGKLTGCEHDFARLLYISKNFFLIQGAIKNSFKLQSCPFVNESRV